MQPVFPGASNARIIFKHILPNAVGVLIVNVTLTMSAAILPETALSYLGVGVKSPDTSLGLLISQNQEAFSTRPWLFWFPGLFIVLICLSINFIGDGLRDAFDPRQKKFNAKKAKDTRHCRRAGEGSGCCSRRVCGQTECRLSGHPPYGTATPQ